MRISFTLARQPVPPALETFSMASRIALAVSAEITRFVVAAGAFSETVAPFRVEDPAARGRA